MHEALIAEKLSGSVVRCNICQWRCTIQPENSGVCGMYRNVKGVLYNLNYGLASSVAVDPIEKKPLFHFHPGTQVFRWGVGLQFSLPGLPELGNLDGEDVLKASEKISPQMAVDLAKENNCRGIAWTYNEPSMWFEYTLDTAKLAKQNDLYTVYVTNGYLSPEALDIIGPYLDAWRVDIKGFSDKLYQNLAKIKNWRGILETAQRAKTKWHMHVEVVTNIIPTMNDDDAQLGGIANGSPQNWGRRRRGTSPGSIQII